MIRYPILYQVNANEDTASITESLILPFFICWAEIMARCKELKILIATNNYYYYEHPQQHLE